MEAPLTIGGTVYDQQTGAALPGVTISIVGTQVTTSTDVKGTYSIRVEKGEHLLFQYIGYENKRVKVGRDSVIDVHLVPAKQRLDEVVVIGYGTQAKGEIVGSVADIRIRGTSRMTYARQGYMPLPINTESYKGFAENKFHNPLDEALSTFAIDVDAASYSNFRRFINNGQFPPSVAVRIE